MTRSGTATRPWLLTGASGLVGSWVARRLLDAGQPFVGTWSTLEPSFPGCVAVDLSDTDATAELLADVQPPVILHTAAIASAGVCEQEPERATRTNADLPEQLARAARASGAHLVHLSTDLVFDGLAAPYAEDAEPRPSSHYAATKVDSERRVRAALPGATLLRVALTYGPSLRPGRSPEEQILQAVREGRVVRLLVDEFRTPLYVEDLAEVIVEAGREAPAGLFHVAGPERVSRMEFGRRLAGLAGFSPEALTEVQIADFPARPPRLPDVSLDTRKLRGVFRARPRGVDEGLRRSLQRAAG